MINPFKKFIIYNMSLQRKKSSKIGARQSLQRAVNFFSAVNRSCKPTQTQAAISFELWWVYRFTAKNLTLVQQQLAGIGCDFGVYCTLKNFIFLYISYSQLCLAVNPKTVINKKR